MSVLKPYRFYPKAAIERRATHLLRRMEMQGVNFAPRWPFDTTRVADFLDLGVVWERIEPDEQGAIAARILPAYRQIEINEDILDKPQGFQESTLAHEIGHWMLHINHDEADGVVKQLELDLGVEPQVQPFVCRGSQEEAKRRSQLYWIEWQAQYFAGCLLMPRYVLEDMRQNRDLTRWSHLYDMRDRLGVSISNLVKRLQDLGWIYIPKGTRKLRLGRESSEAQMRLLG